MSCLCLFAESCLPFFFPDDSDMVALRAFRIDKRSVQGRLVRAVTQTHSDH